MNALAGAVTLAGAVGSLAARVGVHASSTHVDGPARADQRAAGERAAAAALAEAGSADLRVLGRSDDGCPQWPAGFVGTIAHSHEFAVAAIAKATDGLAAIGIDIESSAALPAADAVVVLGEQERALVESHERPDWCATLLWSAKEAAFKAWSAATGGLGRVDPTDIEVRVDMPTGDIEVRATSALRGAVAPFGDAVGAYVEAQGCIVTLVRVRTPIEAG